MTPRRAFPFTKVRKSICRYRWPITHVNYQPTLTSFIGGSPLTIPVVVPTTKLPTVTTFLSVQHLDMLVKLYKGFVMAHEKDDPASFQMPLRPSEYKLLTQSHIVEIISPYFTAKEEERHHHQIHDKALEQKSRAAMIAYQSSMPMKRFTELDRNIVGKDGKVAHEWEGVWECDDGTVWFLECKHQMTYDVLKKQSDRLNSSMKHLDKSTEVPVLYVAAEYWKEIESTTTRAGELGYGVMYYSGEDLKIIPNRTPDEV